jgi:hypothetical protein
LVKGDGIITLDITKYALDSLKVDKLIELIMLLQK